MLKKLLFYLYLTLILFGNIYVASSEIVPLKKPIQSKEEKEQKLLIDTLKPLPKPISKENLDEKTKPNKTKEVAKKKKN